MKKGALLAEIASPEVDQQLAQAQADLATAQATANNAHTQAERYSGLVKSNAVSRQDTDTFVNQAASTAAAVRSAQANVQRLQRDAVSFEKVYAPFDGVVTARNIDTGQLINQGAGTELFHMQAIQTLRVYTNVPQLYADTAKRGLKLDLTFPEYPGKTFQGTLVRTADAIDPASRTLLVEIDVDNRDGELLPGSLAQVHFKAPGRRPDLHRARRRAHLPPRRACSSAPSSTARRPRGPPRPRRHRPGRRSHRADRQRPQRQTTRSFRTRPTPSSTAKKSPRKSLPAPPQPEASSYAEQARVHHPAKSGSAAQIRMPPCVRAALVSRQVGAKPQIRVRKTASSPPFLLAALTLLAGCKPVGPNYNRPAITAPPAYKETGASTAIVPPPNPAGGLAARLALRRHAARQVVGDLQRSATQPA